MHLKRAACTVFLLLASCGEERTEEANVERPAEPPPEEPASNEACAQVIVVAWQGAVAAAPTVTRSEEEARARIENLRERLDSGEDFAAIARADSDAASSGPRGGLIGTYTREDWPEAHVPIRDAVFALSDRQTTDVITAPYGYVIARRCPVEKAHTRHILIRYAGARNADEEITRTRDEAEALANGIRVQAVLTGADFAALAREHSEDGSAERGGDVGNLGRGRLAPAYEEAAFALRPHQVSPVVETEFGFHVIQRLP